MRAAIVGFGFGAAVGVTFLDRVATGDGLVDRLPAPAGAQVGLAGDRLGAGRRCQGTGPMSCERRLGRRHLGREPGPVSAGDLRLGHPGRGVRQGPRRRPNRAGPPASAARRSPSAWACRSAAAAAASACSA